MAAPRLRVMPRGGSLGGLAPARHDVAPGDDAPTGDLARLCAIVRENDQMQARLDDLRARLRDAADYLRGPDANATLGAARLSQLRDRRAATLDRLRANRIEALEILARHGHVEDLRDGPRAA